MTLPGFQGPPESFSSHAPKLSKSHVPLWGCGPGVSHFRFDDFNGLRTGVFAFIPTPLAARVPQRGQEPRQDGSTPLLEPQDSLQGPESSQASRCWKHHFPIISLKQWQHPLF